MSAFMNAKSYSPRSIESYVREMRFLFAHFNDLPPKTITQNNIIDYINFIKIEHGVSRDKCRMTAQSCSFFYKHIFKSEFIIPNAFYPRKEFRLPEILAEEQVVKVLETAINKKHKLIIGLFYGTGMRMSELKNLKMQDFDRKNFQIKVVCGKGSRDRFTLLPKQLIADMEGYYRAYRPKTFHPHVHCIVTAGGYDGKNWIEAKRKKNNFLFPEKSLQKMYKAKFLEGIAKLKLKKEGIDYQKIIHDIGMKKWNVYAKAPFGGPAQVVEYVGRYTHKIAITKHRIVSVTDKEVRFRYKDYTDGDKQKVMPLTRQEFLRRFELHFLPAYFTKIRHYGFIQNNSKRKHLIHIRELLKLSPLREVVKIPVQQRILEKYGKDITLCPCCKTGKLEIISTHRIGLKLLNNDLLKRFGKPNNKEPTT
jgi:site-specific recombinase XerD